MSIYSSGGPRHVMSQNYETRVLSINDQLMLRSDAQADQRCDRHPFRCTLPSPPSLLSCHILLRSSDALVATLLDSITTEVDAHHPALVGLAHSCFGPHQPLTGAEARGRATYQRWSPAAPYQNLQHRNESIALLHVGRLRYITWTWEEAGTAQRQPWVIPQSIRLTTLRTHRLRDDLATGLHQ